MLFCQRLGVKNGVGVVCMSRAIGVTVPAWCLQGGCEAVNKDAYSCWAKASVSGLTQPDVASSLQQ